MKKQPKKKFVLEFFNYRCYLYRRNSKHKYNSEPILTIDYSTHDVLVVDITFNNLSDVVYDSPSVKYEHHLKYIRKMSRAVFAFYKLTNDVKKWET